ncbi:MAG: sigma-70 family RNA polymerase sigma factor [bacterium]
MESLTDEQLVRNLQCGVDEAFEELYNRYKRSIYGFCLKLTANRPLAEDAVQDTFLQMYQNVAGLNDPSLFRSWLYTIARNRVYRLIRKNKSNGKIEGEKIWEEETPAKILETCEEHLALSQCLDALKPEYREVLQLREYEDLSYTEIASVIGEKENIVKARLFKARRALAERMRKYFQ